MRALFAMAVALTLTACGGTVSDAADAASDGSVPDGSDDAAADTAGCVSACLGARLGWEWNGGLAIYYDKSAALPCNTYQRQRFDTSSSTTPTLSCTSTIRHCGGGDVVDGSNAIAIEEIASAVASPDVQAAFAKAPVLYGIDPRAYDGQVFRITIGSKAIEVGEACGSTAGCKEPPAGVKALAALLQDLDMRKTGADACPQFR